MIHRKKSSERSSAIRGRSFAAAEAVARCHEMRAEGVVVGREERAERFRLNGESAQAGVRSAVTFSDITGSAIG